MFLMYPFNVRANEDNKSLLMALKENTINMAAVYKQVEALEDVEK